MVRLALLTATYDEDELPSGAVQVILDVGSQPVTELSVSVRVRPPPVDVKGTWTVWDWPSVKLKDDGVTVPPPDSMPVKLNDWLWPSGWVCLVRVM